MRLKRKLIVLVLLIVFLGAGYYFVMKYEPPKEQTEVPGDKSVILFEAEADKLTKIEVKNPSDSFTLIKEDEWIVEGKEYIELTNTVNSYVYYFAKISAADIIEETAGNMAVYGLDEPQAEVTVTAGELSKSFAVGDTDPTGKYRYVAEDGGKTVYAVSKTNSDVFFSRLNSLRDMTVTDISIEEVRGIKIKSRDRELNIVYAPLPEGEENAYGVISVWDITSPISAKARNNIVVENLLTPACMITASDIVEDNPADLSKYGFDTEITITLENGEESLSLGKANGVNYIYPKGALSVYSVSPGSIAFADIDVNDIMETFVAIYNVDKVARVSYESGKVTGTLEKDGDSYYFNGSPVNKEAFTSIYQAFIGLTADGVADKSYNADDVVGTIHYSFTDGKTDDVVFFGYDELNYAVVRNKTAYYIKKTKIDALEEKLSS